MGTISLNGYGEISAVVCPARSLLAAGLDCADPVSGCLAAAAALPDCRHRRGRRDGIDYFYHYVAGPAASQDLIGLKKDWSRIPFAPVRLLIYNVRRNSGQANLHRQQERIMKHAGT
jgi:hypothetical protein